MKRCPTCQKTFSDRNLSFCIDDGTPLLPVADEPDHDEETTVRPSVGSPSGYQSSSPGTAYEPPRGYVPPGTLPGQPARRKAWPWVVGIIALLLLALAGLGIAAATFIPSILRSSNENAANSNANVFQPNLNENLHGNSNSENVNSGNWNAEETTPPTSEPQVLLTLTDLENEWTVANINADKKKLNLILADDYVGKSPDGKTQGKAEYLRTIQRDTVTQRWEFKELKVSLLADRATLTGVLRMEVRSLSGEEANVAYRFTDKFVWRDNRWQAVSSEVKQEE